MTMEKAKRSRADEILEKKARKPRDHFCIMQLEDFQREWAEKYRGARTIGDLVPIRIVTILEVFSREWFAKLIDHGPPYLDHASEIFKANSIKIDFAVSCALQGKTISLGELLA